MKAFAESLGFEARHGVTAHRGVTMATPTTYFVEMTALQIGPLVGLGVVVCLFAVVRARRRGLPIASLVFLLTLGFGFIAMLTMCPLADARYALPGTVLLFAAGGIGLATGSELLGANGCVRCIWTAVLICSAGMFQGRACADLTKQFRNDSRYRLVEWAAVNLPREAVVAQDARAGLTRTIGRRGEWIANTEYIRSAMFVPALGALDELRAGGVQYVIIVDAAYGRFLNPRLAPSKHADGTERQSYQKSRSFYTALLAGKDELVWSSGRAATGGMYPLTNPEIRVYRLAPVAGK